MHIVAERLRRVGKAEQRNNGNDDGYGRHRQETDEQPRLDGQVLFHYWPRVLPRKSAFAMNLFYAKKRLLSGFRRCSCSVRAAYGFCARIRFDLLDNGFHLPNI